MTFLGRQGMIDPARPKVKVAVDMAKKTGLRCIMITGDYEDRDHPDGPDGAGLKQT
jgi:Ca2+-transporting ATPase